LKGGRSLGLEGIGVRGSVACRMGGLQLPALAPPLASLTTAAETEVLQVLGMRISQANELTKAHNGNGPQQGQRSSRAGMRATIGEPPRGRPNSFPTGKVNNRACRLSPPSYHLPCVAPV